MAAGTDLLEGQSVLVTGGAGFIGSHLAEALLPANDVRVLDDLSSGREANVPAGAEFVEGSVRDPLTVERAIDGVDTVFHEAAVVDIEESIRDPTGTHAVNVDGTLTVLEAARATGARVVLASSAAIYGSPADVPVRESDRKQPRSPYGLEKLAADRYARLYHELYGTEAVALRYFNVYGPRQTASDYSGVVSVFLEQAARGEPLTVHGDGEQTRDFVHVDDVVRANLHAATADVAGEAINVGTGEPTSIRRLAMLVIESVGSESEVVHTEPREGDVRNSCAHLGKARRTLGFEPTVPLEDGIRTLLPPRPRSP